MAILDLGLSFNANGSESLAGVRVYPSTSIYSTVYAVFSTESGTDWQDTFDVSCCYRYVPRAGTGISEDGYSTWSDFYWSNIPAWQCNPHKVGSRWWWAIPLGSIGEYLNASTTPSRTNIQQLVAKDGWGFDERVYDAINLQIHIKSHFVEGKTDQFGNTVSNLAQADSLWVGYFPDYTLTGILKTHTGLQVTYSAPGWERNDDRFIIEVMRQDGQRITKSDNTYWNSIYQYGKIDIPLSEILRMPKNGPVYARIRMNASFRDFGMDFGYIEGTEDLYDTTVCSMPRINVISVDRNEIIAVASDSGDLPSNPLTAINVGIQDEPDLETDVMTVRPGEQFRIPYPPLGVPIVLWAYGINSNGATSDRATTAIDPIETDGATIIAAVIEGSAYGPIEARFNVSQEWNVERVKEKVKFAGRYFESVAYGTGVSSTGTLKFDIIDDEAYGYRYQDRNEIEGMARVGICIYRTPDGDRRRVCIDDVKIEFDTHRQFRTCTINMTEVP